MSALEGLADELDDAATVLELQPVDTVLDRRYPRAVNLLRAKAATLHKSKRTPGERNGKSVSVRIGKGKGTQVKMAKKDIERMKE